MPLLNISKNINTILRVRFVYVYKINCNQRLHSSRNYIINEKKPGDEIKPTIAVALNIGQAKRSLETRFKEHTSMSSMIQTELVDMRLSANQTQGT